MNAGVGIFAHLKWWRRRYNNSKDLHTRRIEKGERRRDSCSREAVISGTQDERCTNGGDGVVVGAAIIKMVVNIEINGESNNRNRTIISREEP